MKCKPATQPYISILRCVVLSIGAMLLVSQVAHAAPSVKEVDAAVDKAVAYLLSQQKPDGSWENGPRLDKPETTQEFVPSKYATYGGETSIVTYALLAAGQSAESEPIKKAV